jgi:2-desacetyl-2-hydroxyethyl bacteriochlorophyllide A dehydrogenase
MRAVVIRELGPPEVLRVEDIPVPEPGPGEVLVRVRACGLCYHDVVVRNGTQRRLVELPRIEGHEIAGEVVEVGEGVHRIATGDRVASKQTECCGTCRYCRNGDETLCDNFRPTEGGNAEYVVVREEPLVKVPDEIPYEQAAILACAIGVGYHGIRRARVTVGDTVLVTGAGGGVGLHAVQVAKVCGARVIAQTGSESKVSAIREMGADEVIVSPDLDFSGEVRRLTDAEGASVVLENVGARAFESAWRSLGKAGRFVFIGATSDERISINPGRIFMKGATLIGSTSTTRSELEEIVRLVQRGVLTPRVSATCALEDAPEAHRQMENRAITGRLVFTP